MTTHMYAEVKATHIYWVRGRKQRGGRAAPLRKIHVAPLWNNLDWLALASEKTATP